MTHNPFSEANASKQPALKLLTSLGWQYLSPKDALGLRNNRTGNVILESVLQEQITCLNKIDYKGKRYDFSDANIHEAIQSIRDIPYEGLQQTNETAYDLLTLGRSLTQLIDGDKKSFTLKYIDWEHPENNVYHVTEEFAVNRPATNECYIPDLVLFVNGIPLGVIECKRPNLPKGEDSIKEAISQQIRNQKDDGIQRLFYYAQVLFAVSGDQGQYATVGTAAKFWSVWRERNAPEFLATEQDRLLWSLCRPARFLDMIRRYILVDEGEKKIARYQQYYCVEKIIDRIHRLDEEEKRRPGGVVWHTQGSGKSLTMVLLAQAIIRDPGILNYRIIIVTDRVDLDEQIYKTFRNCGAAVEKAASGNKLVDLLQSKTSTVITTVIDKFEAAAGKQGVCLDDPNIFVLVDESHRSQYGSIHAKMRRTLPRACYIGFTGTPILKKDKNTVAKFGGMIDTYTITQAVADKAVVRLLYEGRDVRKNVKQPDIDIWFERVTENISDETKADLKRKMSTGDVLYKAEPIIRAIAWDIRKHFLLNWQGTGLKGQLVAPDKRTAILYKQCFDEFGDLKTEVLISGPDDREGNEDFYSENKEPAIRFWKKMVGVSGKYSNERQYNKQIIDAFKHGDPTDPYSHSIEIIIVVDKLLTGFDAPRNTVLYLARMLRDHSLLQAIARVNRLFDGKDFGYIIDYRGVFDRLHAALDIYGTFSGFDEADLTGTLIDVREIVSQLPQSHAVLLSGFNDAAPNRDAEKYVRYLDDEERRIRFYNHFAQYVRLLGVALSSVDFLAETPEKTIDRYKEDLKYFKELRQMVRRRYAEIIDFSEYELRIRKLLDTHLGADKVDVIMGQIDLTDAATRNRALEQSESNEAKAEMIVNNLRRTIKERWEEDPVFFKRFSEMLTQLISDLRAGRLKSADALKKAEAAEKNIHEGADDSIPAAIRHRALAVGFYRNIKPVCESINLSQSVLFDDFVSRVSLEMEKSIRRHLVVHWSTDIDVQNRMRQDMEDALFEIKDNLNVDMSFEKIDEIMEKCLDIARARNIS